MPKTVEATGRVKIIKTPAGEAPLELRAAWVGTILPCYPHLGYLSGGSEHGILTGEKSVDNRRGVIVPQDRAIAVLAEHDSTAAAQWKNYGFPQPEENFFFGEDELEIVSGVTPAPVRVFDDMETGYWREMLH